MAFIFKEVCDLCLYNTNLVCGRFKVESDDERLFTLCFESYGYETDGRFPQEPLAPEPLGAVKSESNASVAEFGRLDFAKNERLRYGHGRAVANEAHLALVALLAVREQEEPQLDGRVAANLR